MTRPDALLSPAITKRVIKRFTRIPQPAPPRELQDLTERERDVFRLLARGLSNAEIGQELYISDTTVKTHITHILQKLDLRDRVQAVVLAYETGLFDTDEGPPSNLASTRLVDFARDEVTGPRGTRSGGRGYAPP
jgi:DNA-binding NarL/FixJ family response regulator